MKSKFPLILTIIVLAASYRLFDNHTFNFTPIGAIALFSGAVLGKNLKSLLIPLGIMLLSDVALQISGKTGFHAEMPFVYGAFALTFFLGRYALNKKRSALRIFGASLTGSLAFFIITNFGSWILSPAYAKDIAGLVTCYTAAIPFYNPGDYLSSFALNGVMSDLFFNTLLFGSFYLSTLTYGKLTPIRVKK